MIKQNQGGITMKMKQKLMILMCISTIFLNACSSSKPQKVDDSNDVVQTKSQAVEQETDVTKFTNDRFDEADLYHDWTKSKTTIITMNEIGITHDGDETSGVTINGRDVTITKAGNFSLTGACADGTVTVDCEEEGNVRIILDNCSLTSQSGSALKIENADKVVVTSAFNTSNLLSDGQDDAGDDAACVTSKADLTFNGEGQLTILGNSKDAVSCDGDLKFTAGTYNINSKENGVVSTQGITLKNGSYTMQSNGAGFKTTSTDDGKGFIGIETGSYMLITGGNAIDAAGSVYYLNGSLNIETGMGSTLSDGVVAKGVQAGANFEMYGGSAQLNTADDAVLVNGNVKIATGCLNISSQDDGIVAGEDIEIAGGSIVLSQCVEGFESNSVNLKGGFVDINATNDGINVCGGNDGSVKDERVGRNSIERSGEGEISIDKTCINVKADADAIDVVGNLTVASGAVYLRGGQADGNSSVDCSKDYVIKSGNVNAAGMDAVVATPGEASNQNTVVLEYAGVQAPNAVVCIEDKKGNIVSCFAPAAPFSKAIISKETFKDGEKYSWFAATINDDAQTKYGEVSCDDIQKGDKIADFTMEKGTTTVK